MTKKRVGILVAALIIIASFNFYFFYSIPKPLDAIKGFKEIALNLKIMMGVFIAQWLIAFLIATIIFIQYQKNKKIQKQIEQLQLPKKISGNKIRTEIDLFYEILKIKGSMKLNVISKKFNISKEKALEWAKILENHELAQIDYPAFGNPRVKTYEKEIEEKAGKEKMEEPGKTTKGGEDIGRGEKSPLQKKKRKKLPTTKAPRKRKS
ncbi:MAG: hypothetical protein ABIF88_00190 [archaeon]